MKRKYYSSSLCKAIDYIEENIKSKLTIQSVAEHSGFSKFHLIRLFETYIGMSLMEYIRARKLSLSLYEIKNTDMRIIDIAMEYSFQHPQTYIRSFKILFGTTPSSIRESGFTPINIVEKANVSKIDYFCKQFYEFEKNINKK